MQAWRFAQDIRAYVAATERLVADAGLEPVRGGTLHQTLEWAKDYARRIDPLEKLAADVQKVLAERDRERP